MLRLFRPHGPPPLIRLTPWRRFRKLWYRLTRLFDTRRGVFHLRRTRRRIGTEPTRSSGVKSKTTLKLLGIVLLHSQSRGHGRKKTRSRVGRATSPKYQPRHLQQSRGRRLLMRSGKSKSFFHRPKLRSRLIPGRAFAGPLTPRM